MAGSGQSIGEMSTRLLEILAGVEKVKVVENSVEGDVSNVKTYLKEVATVCKQMFHLVGENLEQGH